MIKRVSRILLLLGLLATLPVMAIDYHHSRTDGIQVVGTSVGQQSSNQAFNIFDSLLDAAASNFALYWMGELQESGGQTVPPFGDYPPTTALQDNRAQDDEVDWTTWQVVSTKTLGAALAPPARPIFTPNVPQAWSPVEFDLDQGTVGPDHFIVAASFEPTTIAGSTTNMREQILNAYYPQTAAGLPGNDPSNTTGPMGRQKGTVVPFWKRASNGLPGLRIRDLEPVRTQSAGVADPGVGVITQPLIAARVPATYKGTNGTTSETLPVVYLVVGTGENGDYAHVICVSLKRPLGSTNATMTDWLPDINVGTGSTILSQVEPPDPDYFKPTTGGGGSVMWSYRVQDAAGNPMPVAGISFANIGTTSDSQPLLFVTASKFDPLTGKPNSGRLICLNAKAADILDTKDDGDPKAGEVRWEYTNPSFTPNSTGVAETPGYWYGMAPAVCRVPLTNVFPGKSGDESEFTISRAMKSHDVTEWEVFVADSVGIFRAFEAGGKPLPSQTDISSWQQLLRWEDIPTVAGNPEYRMDRQTTPAVEKFVVPPLVYQGNTPLKTDNGALVAGSSDVGFDDEVIFASEKGTIYALDAVGRFVVNRGNAGNDGTPTRGTDTRWTWPDNDTAFTPAAPMTGDADEPRVWPRQLGNPNSTSWFPKTATPDSRQLGTEIALDANYLCRSPLAVTLGANANPNGSNPNLDDGDDVIFVPYLHSEGLTGTVPDRRKFYEYIGSLKPYGFVQASRPISQLTKIEVSIGGKTRTMPLDHVRVGSVKTNGVSSTETATILAPSSLAGQPNPNVEPGVTVEDTIYVVSPTWYDETNKEYVQLPTSGVKLFLTYDAPTSATNSAVESVTESIDYPSCYRLDYPDADAAGSVDFTAPIIRRSRASLSVDYNRLEQRRVRRASGVATVTDELPAEIDQALVETYGWRPAAMMASGSGSTNGTLMAPTWFRGRIIAFSNRLLTQRVLLGCYDPRIDPAIGGAAAAPWGPTGREFRYDPGVFYADFLDDEPLVTDVGGSVVLVDGWAYVMYRNGHFRAFSNVGGGAAGTQYYPPIFYPPASPNNGNLVRAPSHDATDANRGIHISKNPAVANSDTEATNTANYLDISGTLDQSVMLEMGQMIYIIVDFGPRTELTDPQTIDPNAPRTPGSAEIDMQVLQYEVQSQLRSSNGAVQQLPGLNRGVRPTVKNNRIVAVIPVFTGVPSATNPLTPGTPMLWEKQPADFTGEVTFDIQVTQQGVQWRWPGGESQDAGGNWKPDPNKQHFWENERNTGATRFATTGGTTDGAVAGDPPANAKWSWASEWAPLFSYNNCIMLGYDPDGVNGSGVYGIASPAGSTDLVGRVEYTTRNQPGRKNGDVYIVNSVDGSRSGSGQPVVPVVGMAVTGSGAGSPMKQILFAGHGTSSAASSTNFPELAKLRVGDRSYLAVAGRNLTLRVQPAPLTKMGVGALFGRTASGDTTLANLSATGPAGSFEQNVLSYDDGPDGAYASIPESRIVVTKDGTNLNLVTSPIQVPGRDQNGVLPQFGGLETLAVQVDVPRYTADDVYSTRWRSAGPLGADPRPTSGGGSTFNPFFNNGTYAGIPARGLRDRAEKYAKGPLTGQGPNPAMGEDPGLATGAYVDPNQNYDDRLRRVVIYNDANNNGQLDLLPTYREAYRTFAIQVAVKPELKLDVSQQVLDLGAVWHGKKQPGLTGGGVNEIREWQQMNLMSNSAAGADANVAAFYRQYWRQFNIYNLGNTNLSVVKPEVAYQSAASGLQLVGLPSEGNDPWRALSLIAGLTAVNGGPNPLTDPYQIFLRTSFDDQLLPDTSPYGTGGRGVWLQKAPAGSSQPGAVAYAEKVASANTLARDPTFKSGGGALTAEPRETWLTLNIPTGAALGQYSGSLRFYNDRTVAFKEDLSSGSPVGFRYERPAGLQAASVGDGILERDTTGEPLEPASDSPLRIKAKITENLVHGRYQTAAGTKDPQDRRMQPAAVGYTSPAAQGTVQSIVLAYAGNRFGLGSNQPALYDLFGTQLKFDTGRFLFPFDELPLDRAPWADLTGGAYGWTNFTNETTGSKISRPSVVQDINGVGVMAWTEQQTVGGGNDLYRIYYQGLSATPAPTLLQPGGQAPDMKLQRSGVRMISAPVGATNNWLAIYSAGTSARRSLMYTTTTADPTQTASSTQWSFENLLATSSALTSVNDPSVFTMDAVGRPTPVTTTIAADANTVPAMVCVAYTGSNSKIGRSDVYFSRYRTAALTTAGQRGVANQQGRDQDFAQVSFPRTENDVLKPDVSRTTYISGGLDFLIPSTTVTPIPTVGPGPIQLYLARADVAFGAAVIGATGRSGSLASPLPLIGVGQATLGQTPQGELVFGLNPQLVSAATGPIQTQLQGVRIFIDRSAGTFRLNMDARRLAGLVITTPAMTPASPDPVLSADYTAATMRITRGDVSASDAVIVPVMSRPGQPAIYDASWYKQQNTPNAWATGSPVPGQADRLWVIWRRTAGAVAGGPTTFYKVLRPGIRVRAGQITAITPAALTFSPSVTPEEVNPSEGTIFFPASYEGQRINVTYLGPGGGQYIESHIVSWQEETGERPLPMENSVNEGTLDAFASYEDATMQGGSVRKMERMWVFWSSTRTSGGDLYYATLAPRIGPDVNVQGSINYSSSSAASPAALSRLSPNSARATLQQFALYERRYPFVVPRVTRRGPYMPTRATGIRPARR